jgi:hypothetical protein
MIMKSEITLNLSELQTIVEFVNAWNPVDDQSFGSGTVTIRVDSSSGIGQVTTATIPMACGNYYGTFTTEITGIKDW